MAMQDFSYFLPSPPVRENQIKSRLCTAVFASKRRQKVCRGFKRILSGSHKMIHSISYFNLSMSLNNFAIHDMYNFYPCFCGLYITRIYLVKHSASDRSLGKNQIYLVILQIRKHIVLFLCCLFVEELKVTSLQMSSTLQKYPITY